MIRFFAQFFNFSQPPSLIKLLPPKIYNLWISSTTCGWALLVVARFFVGRSQYRIFLSFVNPFGLLKKHGPCRIVPGSMSTFIPLWGAWVLRRDSEKLSPFLFYSVSTNMAEKQLNINLGAWAHAGHGAIKLGYFRSQLLIATRLTRHSETVPRTSGASDRAGSSTNEYVHGLASTLQVSKGIASSAEKGSWSHPIKKAQGCLVKESSIWARDSEKSERNWGVPGSWTCERSMIMAEERA